MLGFLKPIGTAILGKVVKKGVKTAGKTAVKGVKGAAKGATKGVKSATRGAAQVAGGLTEAVKMTPHALLFSATLGAKWGIKSALDQLKTILGGAYLAGAGAVRQKQAAKIIGEMLKTKAFKNIRDTNQLSKALMGFYNANRARQPAVKEIIKYTWRGFKKIVAKAPEQVKKIPAALKDTAKGGMSDYIVGRAVQIGGASLMGIATTAGTVAIADEVRGKK